MKIELGQVVRDRITGFSGTVVGRAEYLTGCTQLCVSPPVDERGAYRESHWFDEDRLELAAPAEERVALNVTRNGGPQEYAPTP